MYTSQMALLQPIIDLAEICYRQGIRRVVVSPGSRSAALTLAFTRHGGFDIQVVMDERAAGFIALGIAQQLAKPVILICTSGSAAYNYAPAVAEAFFQQIPLLIFTADRPKEWIHQHEGQTIYQTGIYGNHVRKSFEIPADYLHDDARWFINRTINEAILSAYGTPSGPVHVNVPIREPFYPVDPEQLRPSPGIRVISRVSSEVTLPTTVWHELINEWEDSKKILIVGGQYGNSSRLNAALSNISSELDIPVIGDVISNQKGNSLFISHQDIFLRVMDPEPLRPDLLITYGLSLISKELKQFLRKYPAIRHWHVSEDPHIIDTYQSLTRQITVSPEYFFESIFERIDYQLFTQGSEPENDSSYALAWQHYDRQSEALLDKYLGKLTVLNDFSGVNLINSALIGAIDLHIANSMPIRYLNILGQRLQVPAIFSNRGTSGIDGCVSTAIGAATATQNQVILITGDVAFLYDRNGLLINPLPANLKIVVFNNAGGNIFRMIEGPSKLPELETYFETRHHFSAKRTAEDSGIAYFSASTLDELNFQLKDFLQASSVALLEVFTDPDENGAAWLGFKSYVTENW